MILAINIIYLSSHNNKERIRLGIRATVVLVCIFVNGMKNQNHRDRIPNIFASKCLVQNVVFIMRCLVKAVQDDISAKTVPIILYASIYLGKTAKRHKFACHRHFPVKQLIFKILFFHTSIVDFFLLKKENSIYS